MGTKVQIENYLSAGHHSTRDLSREYNCYNDVNMPMPNGQFYYGFLPETVADSCNGYDKDIVKQTMLKHEAIFKEQVYELHRLYRVQRDLMDEVRRTQTLKQHVSYEASSSSSALPLQMQSEDVQRCNGSSFPSTSQFFGRPFMSGPDNYQFPPNSAKGKTIQAGSVPLQNFYSSKNSEASESKPSKLQKRVFDLELPADEYIDTNNNFIDLSLSPDESRRPTSIADLNEPLNAEGLSAFSSVHFLRHAGSHADVLCRNLSARSVISSNKDTPQYSKNGNSSNGALNNSQDVAGNAQDWFCAFESGNGKSTNQGFFTQKAPVPSQPIHVPWGQSATSWMKPDIFTQKSTSIQPNPFLCGVNQSNGLLGAKPAFVSEPPVINGFHPGSSAATSIDVEEINPRGLNGCKTEDPFTVLPWLRGKGSNKGSGPDKGSENPRNGFNNSESRLKILGVSIYDSRPMPKEENHIAAVNPPDIHRQSGCEEIKVVDSRKRKCLFDMNVPCEASDSEQEKMSVEEVAGSDQKTNFRNQFDLNSCITEEETACATSLLHCSSSVKTSGTGIDLEALINLANEDDFPPVHDSLVNDEDSELAKAAASVIVAMSSVAETGCVSVEAEGDDPLQWFVNIACSSSLETVEDDGLPLGLEDFEYMILRQKECTPEEYLPKPSTPDFPAIENGSSAVTNTRTRKGQARRGRQKRDFQRDILPGLTTLSRNEVTEDLQTFGGLLRETGFSWQIGSGRRTGAKNGRGRGRPRTVVVTETPPAPAPSPPSPPMMTNTVCGLTLSQKPEVVVQMTKNVEISVLEDRSLRGWGKTTRRPRRQRFPAGNPDLLVP